MPRIIMDRAFIARSTRMPHSIGRLSTSASSHHSLSSAAFITNIAESDFRHAQYVDPRDGRGYFYFRRRGYPHARLSGLPWSPSFMAAYEAAMSGPRTAIGAGRIKPGSVAAVVAEYFDSQSFFTSKGAGTQRMRRGILERFRAAYGERPMASLPADWIEALLDQKPPHAARSWLVTLRSLCAFALRRGYLRTDPTANIKQRAVKGDGFHTWTEDEIAQFEAHYPIGTKPRLAFALLLYTAQRRSDVV